jgi:hypothetical protein
VTFSKTCQAEINNNKPRKTWAFFIAVFASDYSILITSQRRIKNNGGITND